ncbi:hypothetical protein LX83_000967 [Goodfellowiella coeruleoviolacea]|uniref:Uncharacterized protein n=1 Tax=Goodfellowiella coeruleoviolacea TaxID=334858 RepID=A0AAE3GBA6_9PSEU|nr:hypothetical protein [Goodfellowiella coeruleoviolacea]
MFHRRAATTTGVLVVALGLALTCGDVMRLSEAPAGRWLPALPVLVAGLVLLASAQVGGTWASTALGLVGLGSVVAGVLRIVLLDQTPGNAAALVSPLTVAACGTVLLGLGTYGRISGCLPADSPYRRSPDPTGGADWPGRLAAPAPGLSLDELAEAEQAMAEGHPTLDQEHLLLLHSPAACRARRVLDARRRRFATRGGGGQHARRRANRRRRRLPPR